MNFPAPFTQNQDDYLQRCFTSWFNVAEGGKRKAAYSAAVSSRYFAISSSNKSDTDRFSLMA